MYKWRDLEASAPIKKQAVLEKENSQIGVITMASFDGNVKGCVSIIVSKNDDMHSTYSRVVEPDEAKMEELYEDMKKDAINLILKNKFTEFDEKYGFDM